MKSALRPLRRELRQVYFGGSLPRRYTRPYCHGARLQRHEESSARSSVSESEVQKFNALHTEWWDPNKNPLIQMNTIRVQYIREQVTSLFPRDTETSNSPYPLVETKSDLFESSDSDHLPFQGLRMLDIGCGGGLLTESMSRLGAEEATGIDPSGSLLDVARRRADTLLPTRAVKPSYQSATAEDWSQQYQKHYDVICILDVIEHIPKLDSVFQAISTLLKPNGVLFMSTLNRTVGSYALTIVGAEYVMGYVPAGTHDWNYYRSPQEVQELLRQYDLQQAHVSGMVLRQPPVLKWDWRLDPNDTNINWIGSYQFSSLKK